MKFMLGKNSTGAAYTADEVFYQEKDKAVIWVAAAVVIVSFLICRVIMLGSMLPCGIALITVLMYKDRFNIYCLPVMLIGIGSYYNSNLYLWGDFAATILCAFIFLLLGKRKMGLGYRATIAAAISIISTSVYYLAANMVYRFDLTAMVWEVFAILGLCWVFNTFLDLTKIRVSPMRQPESSKEKENVGTESSIVAVVFIIMLLFCGLGVDQITLVAGLFLTLILGYKMGIMEGVMAGASAGSILLLCADMAPGVMVVLVFGGLMAGIFKGQAKIPAAICFAAACMGLGLIRGYPELHIPFWDPLIAAGILVLMPRKMTRFMDKQLMKMAKEDPYYDYVGKDKILKQLHGCQENFQALSNLYGAPKDSRNIVAFQFKGMTQTVEQMISDIENTNKRTIEAEAVPRFTVNMGESGYAKEGAVSGDSYLCKELSDGRYVIVLSDGMGKGESAAAESNLAVTTIVNLIEAGFDVELAIKTINSILLLKSENEIFSTIDIGIFDCVTGRLRLFKIGAACTFIKRGDKVQAVKMSALPLGIVDGLHIDFINVRLHPGDEIIMVSDGITDSKRDDLNLQWLTDAISTIKSTDPQTMCDLVINKAVENYGVREKDDLTVLTARIDQI